AKRALLVAVNGYDHGRPGDARNLNTTPDVERIEQLLLNPPYSFKKGEIKVLKLRADTTHKAIVDAFRSFLIAPTRPGDLVFFHYSGHGADVADPNDQDGVDQTLVPSDYTAS